jgi:hypothetical protein
VARANPALANEEVEFMRVTADHFYSLAAVAPGVLLHKLASGLPAFVEAVVTAMGGLSEWVTLTMLKCIHHVANAPKFVLLLAQVHPPLPPPTHTLSLLSPCHHDERQARAT